MTVSPAIRFRRAKPTTDSYQNLVARVGQGAGSIADGGSYGFNPITRNRQQLEMMYRGSWIIGKAVDTISDDMVKAGVDFTGASEPGSVDDFQRYLRRKKVWGALGDGIRWGRLYGGAIAVPMIDGQDTETPLRPDTVTKGQFLGIAVCDRWMLQPSMQLVQDFGPHFGTPIAYRVATPNHPLSGRTIHYTRALRFEGIQLPHIQKQTELGWGMSVVERIFDRLLAFDSSTQGAAQLVLKAYLRTVKVQGLRQILAAGGEAMEALVKQMENIRQFQNVEGLTVIDAEDEWQSASYTFSGLDQILLQFGQQLSGALDIPLVRLFGQSPAGLNSTGESDLKIYYEGISTHQENSLRDPLYVVLDVAHRSFYGAGLPEHMDFTFNPLAGLSEKEKTDIAEGTERSVGAAFDGGLIDRATALRELKQSSAVTGIFTNITDEMIAEAESEEPPPPETGAIDVPDVQPDDGQGGERPTVPPGEEG